MVAVEGGNVLRRVKREGKLSRGIVWGKTSGRYVQEKCPDPFTYSFSSKTLSPSNFGHFDNRLECKGSYSDTSNTRNMKLLYLVQRIVLYSY